MKGKTSKPKVSKATAKFKDIPASTKPRRSSVRHVRHDQDARHEAKLERQRKYRESHKDLENEKARLRMQRLRAARKGEGASKCTPCRDGTGEAASSASPKATAFMACQSSLLELHHALWKLQGKDTLLETGQQRHLKLSQIAAAGDGDKLISHRNQLQADIVTAKDVEVRLQKEVHFIQHANQMMPGMLDLGSALLAAASGLVGMLTEEMELLRRESTNSREDFMGGYLELFSMNQLFWQWEAVEDPVPFL